MDEEAKRKKRKTKGYPNMGIKIQKGDKYFGSGRAVGFAAADGGIKKQFTKMKGPIQSGNPLPDCVWSFVAPGFMGNCESGQETRLQDANEI